LPFSTAFDETRDAFLNQFDDPTLFRYKFLVIVGESRTGKSFYAEKNLGFKNPYVMNSGFDFSTYNADTHDAIILNDIHDVALKIQRYRTLFQSGEHDTTVGDSATNCYAQHISSKKKPIVVTLNYGPVWDSLNSLRWVQSNAKLMDVSDTALYEKAEEDEDTKRRREEHEIDVLRWQYGDYAFEHYHESKKQRLMEDQENADHQSPITQ
jgi:hypothetical protein